MSTTDESPTLTEGWGEVNKHDGVAHYYRKGNALCGARTLYAGTLEAEGMDLGLEDCPRCRGRLDQLGTPAHIAQGDELRAFEASKRRQPAAKKAPAKAKGKAKRGNL